jgi:hypothetical protein
MFFSKRRARHRSERLAYRESLYGELVIDHQEAINKLRTGVGFKNCPCGATFLTHGLRARCPMCGW